MSFHPPIQAWFLFEQNSPNNVLYFQFNPSEMNVDYISEWEEVEVANVNVMTTQFKQRRPKKFTFDLWLNEWGEHSSPYNNAPFRLTVEEQINWLDTRMFPRKNRHGDKFSPPVLIFAWKEFEPVILTSMSVKRTHFRPLSSTNMAGISTPGDDTLFAELNSFSSQFSPGTGSSGFTDPSNSQVFSLPNINALDAISKNRTPTKPLRTNQPGDAIRAVASITLVEYRKSTANSSGGGVIQDIINALGSGVDAVTGGISDFINNRGG